MKTPESPSERNRFQKLKNKVVIGSITLGTLLGISHTAQAQSKETKHYKNNEKVGDLKLYERYGLVADQDVNYYNAPIAESVDGFINIEDAPQLQDYRPIIVDEVQRLMQGHHMDVLPTQFKDRDAFIHEYVKTSSDFYASPDGHTVMDLKKKFLQGKYDFVKWQIDLYTKHPEAFKPSRFIFNEFDPNEGLVSSNDVTDYLSYLKVFVSNYEEGQYSVNDIDQATLESQASEIWSTRLSNERDKMRYPRIEVEANDLGNDLRPRMEDFLKINFSAIAGYGHGIEISKNPDGTYRLGIPMLGKNYFSINHISPETVKVYLKNGLIEENNSSRMISKDSTVNNKKVLVMGVDIIFQDTKKYSMNIEKILPEGITKEDLWKKYGISLIHKNIDVNIAVSELPK